MPWPALFIIAGFSSFQLWGAAGVRAQSVSLIRRGYLFKVRLAVCVCLHRADDHSTCQLFAVSASLSFPIQDLINLQLLVLQRRRFCSSQFVPDASWPHGWVGGFALVNRSPPPIGQESHTLYGPVGFFSFAGCVRRARCGRDDLPGEA